MPLEVLDASYFEAPVQEVARDLIGRDLLVHDRCGGLIVATILETEAYGGPDDPASHAAFRPGGRAAIMSGPPGTVYVYAAYGMYPCFNIVTGPEGVASAVLLRGVRRAEDRRATFGPGRTTRLLGITLDDHGERIPGPRFNVSRQRRELEIAVTPRIGITRAVDTAWRFVASDET
ncbi:MAG TPA: DNA-3-methyladenine glycosylase [Thermomicrobiales bacterium]|nr:DNA-3-methyladenine glycosylase [Thermomicrobiales bacterium]